MYTNLDDIKIRPNMVVTSYNSENGYYRITFIKTDIGTVAIYSKDDTRNVLVDDNETIGNFFGAELLPIKEIMNIMDFNNVKSENSLEECVVFEKIVMSVSEIEEKLNLVKGSLHISK